MAQCILIIRSPMNWRARSARPARIAAFLVPLFMHLSCIPRPGLVHMIMPVDRPDTEITGTSSALIRSVYCDIRVDPIDDGLWRRIIGSNAYAGGGRPGIHQSIPPVAAFLVTVRNTVNAPIRIDGTLLRHDTSETAAMTAEEMRTRFASASYSRFRFDSMLSFRRILNENRPPAMLEYERDTIALMLDFIPPNDSVLKIIAFGRIPADVREFTLRFVVSAMGTRKNMDFDFVLRDFRTTDREYLRIKEKADEQNIYDE